jgi:hypothetical protein
MDVQSKDTTTLKAYATRQVVRSIGGCHGGKSQYATGDSIVALTTGIHKSGPCLQPGISPSDLQSDGASTRDCVRGFLSSAVKHITVGLTDNWTLPPPPATKSIGGVPNNRYAVKQAG